MPNQTLDFTSDTQPLANLCDNPIQLLEQLKSTHRPITLTVDGNPNVVLAEASDYQRLVDLASQAEQDDAIRQGMEDMHAGHTFPLDQVFDEMRERYAISR